MKTSLSNPRILICLPLLLANLLPGQMEEPMVSAINFADSQIRATLTDLGYGTSGVNPDWLTSPTVYPKVTTDASGEVEWQFTSASQGGSWGAGFMPGMMWDLYSLTADSYWLEKAGEWTTGMDPTKYAGGDNRMNIGFFMMNSFARRIAYGSLPGDESVMATAAGTLLNSWMPAVGSLYSFTWSRGFKHDGLTGGWTNNENTIVDSSPNIEILLYQAKEETDTDMWDKALSHFSNLIRDNIRPDGSTVQLTAYDTTTGDPLGPRGWQGYSFESTWSRGQGWALHGFATAWRETRDPVFGEVFHDLYSFYRDNCPADGVPYWDFSAPDLTDAELEFRYPGKNAPALRYARDSSAAALTASSLMLASQLAETESLRKEYFEYGLRILQSLSTPGYLAADPFYNPTKKSILGQGTYTFPGTEKGQVWGDFFFVEALRRYRDIVEPRILFDDEPGWGDSENYSVRSPERWRVLPDRGDASLRLQGRAEQAAEGYADLAIYRNATFDDFDFSFEVRADELLTPANPVDVVFVCGFLDEENLLMVRLSTSGSRSGVFKLVNGVPSLLASIDPLPETQGYHNVTLSVSGNQLNIAFDGNTQAPVIDPAIGSAGFLGFGGTGNSLLFDNISMFGAASPAQLAPRENWRQSNFAHAKSIYARDTFDPDGDGRPNLLEYAFGTDPLVANGHLPGPEISIETESTIEVSYPFNASFTDVVYKVMKSVDGGQSWDLARSLVPDGSDSWQSDVYSEGITASQAVFYRLQVEPRF